MLKIAAFQGECADDFDANVAKVHEVVDRAGAEGADFLCFPETYLSNYGAELACPLDDPAVAGIAEHAGRFDMVTILGLSEREGDAVFNTMLLMHSGQMIGKYRKTMLTGYDKGIFAPDYDLPVFEAKGVRFGVIVCHDSSFLEPAATMRWKGARLLFSPHFNRLPVDSADEHRILVRNNHIGLAALLQMVVVRANVCGSDDTGKIGYGDSAIFSTLGVPLTQAPLFKEALIMADVTEELPDTQKWRTRSEIPLVVRRQLWEAAKDYPEEL
jgi:predicted amidohydrolase